MAAGAGWSVYMCSVYVTHLPTFSTAHNTHVHTMHVTLHAARPHVHLFTLCVAGRAGDGWGLWKLGANFSCSKLRIICPPAPVEARAPAIKKIKRLMYIYEQEPYTQNTLHTEPEIKH